MKYERQLLLTDSKRNVVLDVAEVRVDGLGSYGDANRILLAVQVHESVNQASLMELASTLEWSALKIYDLNARGQNHGVLLASAGWKPSATADAAT